MRSDECLHNATVSQSVIIRLICSMQRPGPCLLNLLLGADGAPDAQFINGTKEVLCAILLVPQRVQLAACSCMDMSAQTTQDRTEITTS